MIFYERVDVLQKDAGEGNTYSPKPGGDNLPCDLTPMTTEEPYFLDTSISGSLPNIEYKMYYRKDVVIVTDRIVWRGRTAAVVGFPERHYVKGRLHHIEITVKFIGNGNS